MSKFWGDFGADFRRLILKSGQKNNDQNITVYAILAVKRVIKTELDVDVWRPLLYQLSYTPKYVIQEVCAACDEHV